MTRQCPALIVSAPASGQGKTTLVAALARRHRNLGRRVRVFKVGPDFLDPMILEQASGHPVYQLDLFMGGEAHCRQLLHEAAAEADLILIEGVMGLFDGTPSTAELALLFDVPVLAVIDGSAMAQTFGAVALGLAEYHDDLWLAGVVANRIAGVRHAEMLRKSLPGNIAWYGSLPREDALSLPERHLGLMQAGEMNDLDTRLDKAAEMLGKAANRLPGAVDFHSQECSTTPPLLNGMRIAVARDSAFSFLYNANLDLLKTMGAGIEFFSPLANIVLPGCDAVWLPGGYPELHLDRLAKNTAMKEAIRRHHADNKPLLAECGGMLYLTESLTDLDGCQAEMTGILPGNARMQRRLAGLGLQAARMPEGELRGHTFHHSCFDTPLATFIRTSDPNGGPGEAIYRQGKLTASYMHFYFPSNPEAAAALLTA